LKGTVLCIIIFLLFILKGIALFAAENGSRDKVAVMNFAANNISAGTARIVRNFFELELFKNETFNILERNQIDLILKERNRQLLQCMDDGCAVAIGKILSADYVIRGSVDKLDGYTINIRVIDVKLKRVIIADSIEADRLGELKISAGEMAERISNSIVRKNRGIDKKFINISANLNYLQPMGYFSDLTTGGFGVLVSSEIGNLFFRNFFLGVNSGYMFFPGKGKELHHASMIPVLAKAGYRFTFGIFYAVPEIMAGISYNVLYYYIDNLEVSISENRAFQPMVLSGIKAGLKISKPLIVETGVRYGNSFEKKGNISFLSFIAGVKFCFN